MTERRFELTDVGAQMIQALPSLGARRLTQNTKSVLVSSSFGQALQFHVLAIGFIEPSLVVFEGMTNEQEPVRLVQHVNQISFLLMAMPRLEPDK